VDLICNLIEGSVPQNTAPEKRFLYEFVSNKKSSFDLDKLDYLNRDTMHTGINPSSLNYERIIKNARLITPADSADGVVLAYN
jgi:HD superfamily phosphohydrolase